MAKFTAPVALNIRLPGGFEAIGAAGDTHRIPDALVEEFLRDQVPLIPGGVTWISQDETSGIPSLPISQANVSGLTTDLGNKYDKAGGTISGAVTVTGALVAQAAATVAGALIAQTSISSPAATVTAARFKGGPWYDVRAYGAVGDGVTDDGPAVQLALNAASAASGGTVFFPIGVYFISTAPLTVYAGTHLLGAGQSGQQFVTDGKQGSVLFGKADTGIIVTEGIDIVGGVTSVSGRKDFYSFRNLRFKNADAASAGTNVLVDLRYAYNTLVENCIFDGTLRGGTAGLRLKDSGHAVVRNCMFQDFPQHSTESQTRAAVEISPSTSSFLGGFPVQAIYIEDCVFSYVGRAIDIADRNSTGNDGIHVVKCTGLFMKKSGTDPFGSDVSTGITCHNNVDVLDINNCKFEDIRYPIKVIARNARVSNIFANHADIVVDVASSTDVDIDGLILSSSASNPIAIGVNVASSNTGPVRLLSYTLFGATSSATTVLSNSAGFYGSPLAVVTEAGANVGGSSAIGAANRCVYVPAVVRQTVVVDSVQVFINTTGVSSEFYVAIYDAQTSSRLAISAATVNTTTTGRRTIALTSSVTLKPGLYYLALSENLSTATFGMSGGSGTLGLGIAQYQATAHPPPTTMAPAGTTTVVPALVANSVASFL